MASDHNERTKLSANALDRASTAALTIGVLAPMAAALYNLTAGPAVETWFLIVGVLIWLFAAGALHFIARVVLGGLR
jgi:hypothetical protein